jgi:transposase InsO family protein
MRAVLGAMELVHLTVLYNAARRHRALGYPTPEEFLAQSPSPRKELEYH